MTRALALLMLVACKSTPAPAPEGGDVTVPKMPPDASTAAPVDETPAPTGASGWYLDGDQQQPQVGEHAKVFAIMKKAPHRAAVLVDEKIEECSSMGGSHVILKGDGRVLHFGGHGRNLQAAFGKGEQFVVAYAPIDPPQSIENKGWCVPARTIDGRVIAALPVASEGEANRLLRQLAN